MSAATKRRRPQFRLSTWLVLVAILGWALIEWPWVRLPESGSPPALNYVGSKETTLIAWKPPYQERTINPDLLYPALALAALVGWKAAWIFNAHRENQPGTPP